MEGPCGCCERGIGGILRDDGRPVSTRPSERRRQEEERQARLLHPRTRACSGTVTTMSLPSFPFAQQAQISVFLPIISRFPV